MFCSLHRKPAGCLTVRHRTTRSGNPHLVLELDGYVYSLVPAGPHRKYDRRTLQTHIHKLRTLFKSGAIREIKEIDSDV